MLVAEALAGRPRRPPGPRSPRGPGPGRTGPGRRRGLGGVLQQGLEGLPGGARLTALQEALAAQAQQLLPSGRPAERAIAWRAYSAASVKRASA